MNDLESMVPVVGELMDDKPRKSPRERFEELAPKRTQAVMDKLRLLANCANRQTYLYEQHEVDQMFHAIEEELRRTRAQFQRKEAATFRFRPEEN